MGLPSSSRSRQTTRAQHNVKRRIAKKKNSNTEHSNQNIWEQQKKPYVNRPISSIYAVGHISQTMPEQIFFDLFFFCVRFCYFRLLCGFDYLLCLPRSRLEDRSGSISLLCSRCALCNCNFTLLIFFFVIENYSPIYGLIFKLMTSLGSALKALISWNV